MKRWMIAFAWASLLIAFGTTTAQEKSQFPAPRFPSYVKPAKSIEEIMPYARAAVRQTGGRTPLGLVEKGMTAALVIEPTADDMVIQAIKRAFEERGVKVITVPEHEIAGVSRDDALKAIRATHWFTSEQGYMEAHRWIVDRFPDAEIPKKWLKERRPDLYKAMFERGDAVPENLRETRKNSARATWARGWRSISISIRPTRFSGVAAVGRRRRSLSNTMAISFSATSSSTTTGS